MSEIMDKEEEKEFYEDCFQQSLDFVQQSGRYESILAYIEKEISEASKDQISVSKDGSIATVFIPWGWAVEKDMIVFVKFKRGTVWSATGR